MSTWHGSCYACTCTSSPHKSQRIARPVPSGARAIGVRAVSSPGPDATLIVNAQIKTHGASGDAHRRLGACGARVPVPVRSDLTGQGFLPYLAGRFGVRSLFGNLRTQLRWQAIGYVLPDHFKSSVLNAPTLDRGEHDEIHETPTFGATHDR